MAADTRPRKGILKNPSDSPAAAAPTARDVAVHHATLLQHRKAVEAEILDSVILLSEFPRARSPPHSRDRPDPADAAAFKRHVRLFQPSDYDDLVEERNANGLCGYALCAAPRRSAGRGGEWAFTPGGEIVRRRELEMWCSQGCARRALYVKVQLSETAAWERAGIPDIRIDLWGEDAAGESEADAAARRLGQMKLEDQRQAARDSGALALERGERGARSAADRIKVALREKDTQAPDDGAAAIDKPGDHLLVEGHKSKFVTDNTVDNPGS